MGHGLHGSAMTTEAIRRAMQQRQASLRALAKRYGINPRWSPNGRTETPSPNAGAGRSYRAVGSGRAVLGDKAPRPKKNPAMRWQGEVSPLSV